MRTLGIDLSANNRKTGVAWLSWSDDRCRVDRVAHGASDTDLVEAILDADKSGIDCPLGWPDAFLDYVAQHRTGMVPLPETERARLTHRVTDRHVRGLISRVQPLSVAADRIGVTAMRCAALQAQLAAAGRTVDRTGRSGPVVEVYPAAALAFWGIEHRNYKRVALTARRGLLLDQLQAHADWLDWGSAEAACRKSDDVLDAVLCAVIAGLAARQLVTVPDDSQLAAARSEGWIALPTRQLAECKPSTES